MCERYAEVHMHYIIQFDSHLLAKEARHVMAKKTNKQTNQKKNLQYKKKSVFFFFFFFFFTVVVVVVGGGVPSSSLFSSFSSSSSSSSLHSLAIARGRGEGLPLVFTRASILRRFSNEQICFDNFSIIILG